MSTRLTGSEPGLVAYLNFDDGTPNDLSPEQNNGTLMGTARIIEDPFIRLDIRTAVEIRTVSGSSQVTYRLQSKPDGAAGEWTDFGAPFNGGETKQFFDSTREGKRIYRVVRVQ